MNVELIKNALTQKTGRAGLYLQKHSPEILLGFGLVGMVATVIMVSRATLKAQAISVVLNDSLEAVDGQSGATDEEKMKQKGMIYVSGGIEFAKLYGPSVGLGVLSIGAILGSHGIMAKRQVALTAAYGLLAEGYKAYRDRVVEEMGEEKDRQYHLGLREEKVPYEEIDPETGKVKKMKMATLVHDPELGMPSIYARCFDNSNPMFRADRLLNRAFLTAQERYANDVLILRGHVFLNEVYERLGFPHTTEGQLVGWVLRSPEQMKAEKRDGYISFGLEDSNANREFMRGENDAIWLDFNVDGIVHTLI